MKLQNMSTSSIKSPGIIKGIIAAFVISLMAGVTSLVLSGFIVQTTLFSVVLYAATLSYLIYLLKNSSAHVGRVVVISSWAAISVVCWLFEVPLIAQVLIQTGSIWLVRTLYFHGSLFAALLDFGLISIGLAASAWAMVNTGSLATAMWSFFLTQALFCWIPDLSRKQNNDAFRSEQSPQYQSLSEQTSFQSAHRVALDAVHKLTQA